MRIRPNGSATNGCAGPIDEEIFTPELVAQRNLCPYQDYVMFNYPTAQETAAIMQRRVKGRGCVGADRGRSAVR